jgi:hypothetical protein
MGAFGGKTAQIDKVSNLLATECTPELAKQTAYSSAILPEITKTENPSQYDNWLRALIGAGYSTSGGDLPTSTDNVHHCDDTKPVVTIVGATGGGPYDFTVKVTSGTFTANKLEVYFDDQIISTQQIDGSGSYSVSYSPTVTGSHTFKAIVTDAGLYQSSDDQAVNVSNDGSSGSTASFKGLLPADGSAVNAPVHFTWTADPGATKYTLFINGVASGASTSATTKTVNLASGAYTWQVKSDSPNSAPLISFTVN